MNEEGQNLTFRTLIDRIKDKSRNRDQLYYDHLAQLFEKAAWATIVWAVIVDVTSEIDLVAKRNIAIVITIAAFFNFSYFRFIYPRIREKEYRFFASEALFPLFIWLFLHFQQGYLPHLLLPYYILVMATALTLRGIDSAIALFMSLFFIVLDDVWLNFPLDSYESQNLLIRTLAFSIFAYVVLAIRNFLRRQDNERVSNQTEALKQTEKNVILKRYTQSLVLDSQKVQIFNQETKDPFILLDHKNKIIEYNQAFKQLSDFKDESLVGKDLTFLLRLDAPLRFDAESFIPEEFEATLVTRRNKEKQVKGVAHFLLGNDKRLKQVMIFFSPLIDNPS